MDSREFDSYTVMVMEDPLAPVRRYQVPKVLVRRAAWFAVAVAVVIAGAVWDYWSVRADNAEPSGRSISATAETASKLARTALSAWSS